MTATLRTGAQLQVHAIDAADRTDMLVDLFRLGVSATSMFRDLAGLADTIRWAHEDYARRAAGAPAPRGGHKGF